MSLGVEGLHELLQELKEAPELYRPSAFWDELAAIGLKQLESSGFENFKRSVNMTYFNWGVLGILQHQFLPIFTHWCRHPSFDVFRARFPNYRSELPSAHRYHSASNYRVRLQELASFNSITAFLYKIYVAMLWEYVSRQDALRLLGSIDEPPFGNPFLIEYGGRATSQDLCNSVHEFYSASGDEAVNGGPWSIAELGGGYGRLSYIFLQALPSAKVCMIDIAPALNVAQEYISRTFPDEKIFYFRPFRNFEEIQLEFNSSRIRFLAAHQIELLPAKQFDLVLNVSSLHEMTSAQIDNYLRQIDRVGRGRFYTKQWRTSQAKVNGVVMKEFDYPIPTAWKKIYHRRHPIQRLFFEALYEIGPLPG